MNSKEIVYCALQGREIPRIPCGPLAVHFCAADMGISIQDFTLNPSVHAECILQYHDKYKPDAIWISADTWVTAEVMGAEVTFPAADQPMCGSSGGFIHSPGDVDRIPEPDPWTQGRQPILLDALSRIVEELGNDVFIVGCFDQSPFSIVCQAYGIETVMTKLMDDPQYFEPFIEKAIDYSTAYGKAMAQCGAHMLSTGDAWAGLLGPEHYPRIALPAEKRVFSRLKETGKILSLHICGDTRAIFRQMSDTGAHVLEFDHHIPIAEAFDLAGREVSLWGNIDPVTVLFNGSREEVKETTREIISEVKNIQSPKFVLSSGCTLAPHTPPGNLSAMIEVARIS